MGLNLPAFQRNRFEEILKKTNYSAGFNAPLTRKAYTRTKGTDGRLTDVTTANTQIDGYIRYVTSKDHILLEQGDAHMGDAVLYVKHDTTINLHDGIIDQDDLEWEVVKLIVAPKIQGLTIHQEFLLKRRD